MGGSAPARTPRAPVLRRAWPALVVLAVLLFHLPYNNLQGRPTPTAGQGMSPLNVETSFNCASEHPDFADEQVCEFTNLVAWNNTLLVVAPTPPASLPRILIAWEKTYEGDEVLRLEHSTPQALEAAMRSALGVGESSEAAPELEVVTRAGLFHQQHAINFYHLFSEILPTMHALLCSRWSDTCGERTAPDLRLFWVNWKSPARPESLRFRSPPAVRDALACLSASETLNVAEATLGPQGAQSVGSDGGPVWKGFVFQQALVGLPRASRVYHQKRPEWRARFSDPPEAELMRSYRRRMAACLGVPFADARAPLDPIRVTLVNRPYEAGRSLLNAHSIAQRIREHAAALGIEDVEVDVLYLEGSLREQARAVAASSLYIWCHGAAMAHAFFLPAGARAVELVQWPIKDPADQHVWVRGIKKAFRLDVGLHVVTNDDQRYNFFNQEILRAPGSQYHKFNDTEKVNLIERLECPTSEYANGEECFGWFHWGMSFVLKYDLLKPEVEKALKELNAMRLDKDAKRL